MSASLKGKIDKTIHAQIHVKIHASFHHMSRQCSRPPPSTLTSSTHTYSRPLDALHPLSSPKLLPSSTPHFENPLQNPLLAKSTDPLQNPLQHPQQNHCFENPSQNPLYDERSCPSTAHHERANPRASSAVAQPQRCRALRCVQWREFAFFSLIARSPVSKHCSSQHPMLRRGNCRLRASDIRVAIQTAVLCVLIDLQWHQNVRCPLAT